MGMYLETQTPYVMNVQQVKRALFVYGAPHQIYTIDNRREDYGRATKTGVGQPF